VARELGISEATFHRWSKHYGGMHTEAMKRLRQLEKENSLLKKIVAEQAVDISILKEVRAREPSEPGKEVSCRQARVREAQGLRTLGVQGNGPTPLDPALPQPESQKG